MKIQYASDLHLELSGNSKYVKEIPFEVIGDVLVLAGDTAYLRNKNLPNVHYYQNKVVRVDDTDFVLSTLWSRINPANEFTIWQGMNDFYQIIYGGKVFLPGHFNDEHEKCLAFIKKSVAESDAKHIVVVTHHLPTMAVVAPHHKKSPLNTAFAVDLHDYIADSRIDVWIYGHSHTNIDTEINGTKVVCNQLGYVQRGEHEYGFDGRKFIEL